MDQTPPSSWLVEALRAAGWFPGRVPPRADELKWRAIFEQRRVQVLESIWDVLREFGGLRVVPLGWKGRDCATSEVLVAPEVADAWFESVEYWAELTGVDFALVGVIGAGFAPLAADTRANFWELGEGASLLGSSFAGALETLLLGLASPILTVDGDWVDLNYQPIPPPHY